MKDDALIEPFAAQVIYCDGFTNHTVQNGNMSCIGYLIQEPSREGEGPAKLAVVRLIFPRACLQAAIEEAQRAAADKPVPAEHQLWLRKAH